MAQSAPTRIPQRRAAPAGRRARSRGGSPGRRRRIAAVLLAAALGAAAASAITGLGPLGDAVRKITLPLNHEDIIRQQAREKGIDPALIAAVIYEESKFRDQTSHAGARGLMQITPATARFIARDSGGTKFTQEDLATPQINISYGAYYLRYLLRRYNGSETLAVAAYNAGETEVNHWLARAGGINSFEVEDDIPFPETRKYVEGVLDHRGQYREHYADELGL
jgi:soluble lytic murein transglycosylase